MATLPPLGSLDAWQSGCQDVKARNRSPFAAIAMAARSASSTEPVPIPRSPHPGPLAPAELVPGQVDPASSCGIHPLCTSSDAERHAKNAPAAVKAAAATDDPSARYSTERQMVPSTSLPELAKQGPVSLASLCTALSSPASNATLAAAHAQHASHIASTSTAEEAAATAAVAAAFARSLAWDSDTLSTASCCQAQDGNAATEAASGLGPVGSSALLCLPPIGARRVSSQGAGLAALAATSCASDCTMKGRFSTKRGLYEGTVRGGIPRNTWQYCA